MPRIWSLEPVGLWTILLTGFGGSDTSNVGYLQAFGSVSEPKSM